MLLCLLQYLDDKEGGETGTGRNSEERVCVCGCVCVSDREREREASKEGVCISVPLNRSSQ